MAVGMIGKNVPCVSVMIPVYKPNHYLRQTLNSVLQQASNCPSLQITLVDDASPNIDIETLLPDLPGVEHIEIHRNENNLGLAGNWNKAISLARGEFVHILHQDDIVLPGFYNHLVNGLKRAPQAGMAFCRHAFIDAHNVIDRVSHRERWGAGLLRNWLERIAMRTRIQCPAAIVRRSAYEEVGGFNADLKYALDWEMWVRIASQFSVWYEPQVLAHYRRHDGNESTRLANEGGQDPDLLKTIESFSQSLPDSVRKKFTSNAYRHIVSRRLKTAVKLMEADTAEAALAPLHAAEAAFACLPRSLSTSVLSARLNWIRRSIMDQGRAKK